MGHHARSVDRRCMLDVDNDNAQRHRTNSFATQISSARHGSLSNGIRPWDGAWFGRLGLAGLGTKPEFGFLRGISHFGIQLCLDALLQNRVAERC